MRVNRENVKTATGVALVAIADAVLIVLATTERGSDAIVVGLAVSAVIAGFLIGRWWAVALALPLFVAIVPMYDQEGYQELSFLGWLIVVAGLIAGIQAAALALGAGSRWAFSHGSKIRDIFSR